MLSSPRLLALLALASIAAGCSPGKAIETGQTCTLNSDCNAPLVCSMGTCHEACRATRDCPPGQSCVMVGGQNVCADPGELVNDTLPSGKGDGGASDTPDPGPTTPLSSDMDILFVIDNSASMDPKQGALAVAFPKMLAELQALPGGLPNLHIGVVSSDMGAGSGESSCSALLGNMGILWGNDPNANAGDQNNKFATVKDLKNRAGDSGCGMNSGARWIENIQSSGGDRTQNYKGDLLDVFSCLAQAVGISGCGYEHQLQSLRVALNPMKNINADQNTGFLRPNAYLAVVIVSDEDDCSADPDSSINDGMFFPRTLGDTGSLRCATRGHVCDGQDIPNYDPATGYEGNSPFVTKFANCDAKDSADPRKLPLIRIRNMIDTVNQVKSRPQEQIRIFGIIGWPQDMNAAEYRIDKDATSMPAEQQKLWDYMPICTVPDKKSADGNIYKAYGGFRLKKFLDAFRHGAETNTYSLCTPDFSEPFAQIGKSLARIWLGK